MTTAHRPTFTPAQGREAPKGAAYHQRLLPAHTHLKMRKQGQGGVAGLVNTVDDSNAQQHGLAPRDLRAELLQAEAAVRARKSGSVGANSPSVIPGREKRQLDRTSTSDEDAEEDSEAKRRRLILEEAHDEDADSDGEDEEDDGDESESDGDEEDEEAELQRELNKIKAERAEQRAKEEADKAAIEQRDREEEIARGNPLLNPRGGGAHDFGVKRRWDDDVVFKNQARGTEEKRGREFVNDLLRSDFHKRFMSKYVR